jgi:hypothetical protein
MREEEFERLRDALVDELMRVTKFDPKMSMTGKMLIAAAAVEFAVLAIANLPAPQQSDAVKMLKRDIVKLVAGMAVTLAKT